MVEKEGYSSLADLVFGVPLSAPAALSSLPYIMYRKVRTRKKNVTTSMNVIMTFS